MWENNIPGRETVREWDLSDWHVFEEEYKVILRCMERSREQ